MRREIVLTMPTRKRVNLKQLHHFKKNPRVEDAIDDFDAVNKLYNLDNASANDLINLALEIAEEGFDENEPVYAVKDPNNEHEFQIYEGNRRLASLSLLANPEKYRDFLTEKHLKALQGAPKNKLTDIIEITIVDEAEAKKLMERNHGGVNNGTGRRPWTADAQRKYAKLNGKDSSFVGLMTEYFENRFGQPISGYIGGITTADRILNDKEIQKYIGRIIDNKPTALQVERVKKVLDTAKEISIAEESSLTRVFAKKKDIKEKLVSALKTENDKKKESKDNGLLTNVQSGSQNETIQSNAASNNDDEQQTYDPMSIPFVRQKFVANGILKYASSDVLIESIENNEINNTFSVLAEFWTPNTSNSKKEKLLYLYAPVARGIFELSFGILKSHQNSQKALSLNSQSTIKGDKIKSIVNIWRKNVQFLDYLVENNPKIFDSRLTIADILVDKDFSDQYNKSNPGAHTGQKHLNIADVENIVNKAELFAIMTQYYIKFLDEVNSF